MSATLLNELYKEYNSLKTKLDKVADLIVSYGGEVPGVVKAQLKYTGGRVYGGGEVHTLNFGPSTFPSTGTYPINGSWKEKILWVMHLLDIDVTVRDVAGVITQVEGKVDKDIDSKQVVNLVTQYLYNMGLSNEVNVDKSGDRIRYSLK